MHKRDGILKYIYSLYVLWQSSGQQILPRPERGHILRRAGRPRRRSSSGDLSGSNHFPIQRVRIFFWMLFLQGVPSGHRLSLVDLEFDFSLCAKLCLGWGEFGRSGLAAGQNGGTLKSKSTKPRSMPRWDTLYNFSYSGFFCSEVFKCHLIDN